MCVTPTTGVVGATEAPLEPVDLRILDPSRYCNVHTTLYPGGVGTVLVVLMLWISFGWRNAGIIAISFPFCILGTAAVKLNQNWVLQGGARYNVQSADFDQTQIGLGYVNDCYALAVNYVANFAVSGNTQDDHRVMVQMSLRTLGGSVVNQSLGQ